MTLDRDKETCREKEREKGGRPQCFTRSLFMTAECCARGFMYVSALLLSVSSSRARRCRRLSRSATCALSYRRKTVFICWVATVAVVNAQQCSFFYRSPFNFGTHQKNTFPENRTYNVRGPNNSFSTGRLLSERPLFSINGRGFDTFREICEIMTRPKRVCIVKKIITFNFV